MKKIKRNILLVLTVIIVLAIIIWIIMQINTNSIMEEVEDALTCDDYYVSEDFTNSREFKKMMEEHPDVNFISYAQEEYDTNLYARFNLLDGKGIFHLEQFDLNLSIKRNYTVHNFKEGYIWLEYGLSIKPKDPENCENPDMHSGGAYPVKLKIKKADGHWTVLDIWTPDYWRNEQDEHDYWYSTKME